MDLSCPSAARYFAPVVIFFQSIDGGGGFASAPASAYSPIQSRRRNRRILPALLSMSLAWTFGQSRKARVICWPSDFKSVPGAFAHAFLNAKRQRRSQS